MMKRVTVAQGSFKVLHINHRRCSRLKDASIGFFALDTIALKSLSKGLRHGFLPCHDMVGNEMFRAFDLFAKSSNPFFCLLLDS